MKQYDKIYIPVNQMSNDGIYLIASSKTTTKPLSTISFPLQSKEWLEEHRNMIVLTMEEAKELWEAAETWILSGPNSKNYKGEIVRSNPDFATYLQSKGINPELLK